MKQNLKKKKKKAPKEYKNRPYYVSKSESLYDIAQRYGIRLKSLVKKNEKLAERGLRIGDEVILYQYRTHRVIPVEMFANVVGC